MDKKITRLPSPPTPIRQGKWFGLPGRKALVDWRIESGLEGKQAAVLIGIPPETYCRIEAGFRRPPELLRPKIEEVTGGLVREWMWSASSMEQKP